MVSALLGGTHQVRIPDGTFPPPLTECCPEGFRVRGFYRGVNNYLYYFGGSLL